MYKPMVCCALLAEFVMLFPQQVMMAHPSYKMEGLRAESSGHDMKQVHGSGMHCITRCRLVQAYGAPFGMNFGYSYRPVPDMHQ